MTKQVWSNERSQRELHICMASFGMTKAEAIVHLMERIERDAQQIERNRKLVKVYWSNELKTFVTIPE